MSSYEPEGAATAVAATMVDVRTSWLGIPLAHPLVASASPLSKTLDGIRQLEDAGASAIVMFSLFEEEIEREARALAHYMEFGAESNPEAIRYTPEVVEYGPGPEAYVDLIRRAKAAVDVPIIASLNGATPGGWTRYAHALEEAGADALELNLYHVPTDPGVTGAEIERRYLEVVKSVRAQVQVPLAVKLGSNLSAPANVAAQLVGAGADGLVLFNRFYQPDLDLETLEVVPHLVLSDSDELRLPLRWVAIMFGRVQADLAITSGVHGHIDVLKGMMAGARVTMVASELLRNGVGRIGHIVEDMRAWMIDHEYDSIAQMQGSLSQARAADPEAFERANYMRVLASWRPDTTGQLA
ncbi:MAG: dihydroorotate dehydrogenase-like protein [Trueperaceae bacterium]